MKKFYECILYTFCRGYLHHFCGYNEYLDKSILELKNRLDEYHYCWLYKILKNLF